MSRNLSEVYPPREYTAADIGAVGLTGDQDISGAKNFLGAVQLDGVALEDVLPSDLMDDYDHTQFTDWLKAPRQKRQHRVQSGDLHARDNRPGQRI